MKTTFNWLLDYCDHRLTPDEAAKRLTMAGLEVEGLRPRGDDVVLEAEVTSNRADLLGAIGIARELSALTGRPIPIPQTKSDGEPYVARWFSSAG